MNFTTVPDPHPNPYVLGLPDPHTDPLDRGSDANIRTKMSLIHNTAFKDLYSLKHEWDNRPRRQYLYSRSLPSGGRGQRGRARLGNICTHVLCLLVEEYREGEHCCSLVQPRGEPLPRVVQPARHRSKHSQTTAMSFVFEPVTFDPELLSLMFFPVKGINSTEHECGTELHQRY